MILININDNLDIMNIVHYIISMPKLIPELESHIRETAERLFIKEGYEDVSMRKIAAELNIAVGTLYNYFPNKVSLFQNIMMKSWEITISKINDIVEKTDKPDSKIRRQAIHTIYQGIKGRGGFAQKAFVIKSAGDKSHTFSSINNDILINRLEEALKPLGAGFSGHHSTRLIITILSTIRFFIFPECSNNDDEDIDFLTHITEVI